MGTGELNEEWQPCDRLVFHPGWNRNPPSRLMLLKPGDALPLGFTLLYPLVPQWMFAPSCYTAIIADRPYYYSLLQTTLKEGTTIEKRYRAR